MDTPHASFQDKEPECMKWKVNVAEKILQVLTKENEIAQKAQTQCKLPCLLRKYSCPDIYVYSVRTLDKVLAT